MNAPGVVDILQRRTFRFLFLGVTLSRIGDAMTFVVISWLALGIGGPRAVGLVVFAGGCVAPFTARVIGYLMDVLGLRVLLLVDNAIRGLLMVGLAAVVHTGHARLGYLVVFAILSALLSPATELGQTWPYQRSWNPASWMRLTDCFPPVRISLRGSGTR